MGETLMNCITSRSEFARNIAKYKKEPHAFFIKVDKIFLKGQYFPWFKIFKRCLKQKINHELLMETYKESLKGQYCSDCIVFWSEFAKIIGKQKWRLNFCEIWIKLYCLLWFFWHILVLEKWVNHDI